jgi:hypothetical protein
MKLCILLVCKVSVYLCHTPFCAVFEEIARIQLQNCRAIRVLLASIVTLVCKEEAVHLYVFSTSTVLSLKILPLRSSNYSAAFK